MGAYNENAYLISIVVKLFMIIMIACLVSVTSLLSENETNTNIKNNESQNEIFYLY